jgi:hypothetical protein
MKEILQRKVIKSSRTLKLRSRAIFILPPSLITSLNVCISYRVGSIGGYKQEQEVLADPQAPSFKETVTPRVSKPHDYANHMFMRL